MQEKTPDTIRLTPEQIKREEYRILAMRENLKRRKAFKKAIAEKALDDDMVVQDSDEKPPQDINKE